MVKRQMYQKIQRYKAQGYSRKRIAVELDLDRGTVRKYYDMPEESYRHYLLVRGERKKTAEEYQADILEVYQANQNRRLNMAAVYDYLEEKYGRLAFSEKTLRNYIIYLTEKGLLTVKERVRTFMKVPELPWGRQMQLDFGEYRCTSGLKLYIFAALLSTSRCKFVCLQDRPFTTLDVIQLLLDCFRFYGGQPHEIVIDQDKLMVVSENQGDIVYTSKFRHFKEEMGFKMYVCRKADPQSKGKVENLVKYVKYNFFGTRDFDNLAAANQSLAAWLERRANGKISQSTKRIPAEDLETEREHLLPIRNSVFRKHQVCGREERAANEKCYIMVNTNNYQVPPQYKGKTVEIYMTRFKLFIYDRHTGEQVACHKINALSGQTIINKGQARRKENRIDDLKQEVAGLFPEIGQWSEFLSENFKRYNRYVRDQSVDLLRQFKEPNKIDKDILREALDYCLSHQTISAANLKDTYTHLLAATSEQENAAPKAAAGSVLSLFSGIEPLHVQERSIDLYKQVARKAEGGSL